MKLFGLYISLAAIQHAAGATSANFQRASTEYAANETNTYDYIVTGSGPGGGK